MGYCVASFRFRPECFHCWKSISILNYFNSTLCLYGLLCGQLQVQAGVFSLLKINLYMNYLTLLCLSGLLCGSFSFSRSVFTVENQSLYWIILTLLSVYMGYCVASFRFRPECFHCCKSISYWIILTLLCLYGLLWGQLQVQAGSVFTVENHSLYWIILTLLVYMGYCVAASGSGRSVFTVENQSHIEYSNLLCLYGLLCGQFRFRPECFHWAVGCGLPAAGSVRSCSSPPGALRQILAPAASGRTAADPAWTAPHRLALTAGSFVMLASWKRKCMCLALPRPGPRLFNPS